MTPNIRRLCANYAAAMKQWDLTAEDCSDDRLLDLARTRMSIESLKNHYVYGAIDIDEFEFLLDACLAA